MSKVPQNQPECSLHAYADDQLGDTERDEIEQLMGLDQDLRKQVADYQRLNRDLKSEFAEVMDEAIPARLLQAVRGHAQPDTSMITAQKPFRDAQSSPTTKTRLRQSLAATLAWFAVGSVVGFAVFNYYHDSDSTSGTGIARLALNAHKLYSSEKRHRVEVPASEQAHLMSWLSKRLGDPVGPADLSAFGYEFLGGRLLPAQGQSAGQYLYQNTALNYLSIYMSPNQETDADFEFHCADVALPYAQCRWSKGKIHYQVIAALPEQELKPIAQNIYTQLPSKP